MRLWLGRARVVVFVAALGGLTACGDGRLKKLSTGIEKDSVALLMGADAPYRSENFLIESKMYEVFYYTSGDVGADSVSLRKTSPVVFVDDKVAGWGWGYWDDEASRLKIELPPKD